MIIRLLGLIAILSVQVPGTVHVRTVIRVLKWYYLCININWPHHPPKKIFFIIYYYIIFIKKTKNWL